MTSYEFKLYGECGNLVAEFVTDNRVNGYATAENLAVRYNAGSMTVTTVEDHTR
jgi:hypothetical protein